MRRIGEFFFCAAMAVFALCPALAQSGEPPGRQMTPSKAFETLVSAPAPHKSVSAAGAEKIQMDLAHQALVDGDFEKARALAEPLAGKNNPAANHLLGYLYEKGLGVRSDIGAALRHYGDAAIAGDVDAQIALGVLAFEGGGVYPDYERAAGWFRLAAAQGDPRADVKLGIMYAEGLGVAQDSVTASNLFAKAASKNDPDGDFFLGVAWMNGDGLPQNYKKAAQSFSRAAEMGHAEAAFHLAMLYDSPAIGAPDAKKAASAMRKAADGGYAPAYAAMGLIVHRGDAPGVAADWFEKGMRAGDPHAALLYAVALSRGDGRAQDRIAALTIAEQLIASRETPDALRAQASDLRRSIARVSPNAFSLRD
ncbi:MAG: sel1 repeat family protein [Parvularculaceae bacterium]|nr:sel1 repeat family protein [Parvularculaceae bacterium]